MYEPAARPARKPYGVGKNSPTVLSRLWTKVQGACRGVPVHWQVSFRSLISCSVAEIFSVKVWIRSPKAVFCPEPVGVNAPGSSDQIFQIAVKWICIQLWLRSVQWPPGLGFEKIRRIKKKKKERKKKKKPTAISSNYCLSRQASIFEDIDHYNFVFCTSFLFLLSGVVFSKRQRITLRLLYAINNKNWSSV